MLTLSDEIKIHIDYINVPVGTMVEYDLVVDDDVIYKGALYYTGPTDIYVKDIVESWVTEYSWFKTPNVQEHTMFKYSFKVIARFSTGDEFESNTIYNRTEIPTVTLKTIPSILPKQPSDEFFFGWLCPTANTKISTSNSTTNVIADWTYSSTGHTVVNEWSRKGLTTVYRLTNQAQKIAITDDHNSRFYLLWITRNNDYMCRPFCKKNILTESVTTNYVYSVTNRKNPYMKASTYSWKLNSDWLTYDEHNVYESLLISPIVYLYDNIEGKMYRVNVVDTEWTEKNANNTKKPFNMTVNVELADEKTISY